MDECHPSSEGASDHLNDDSSFDEAKDFRRWFMSKKSTRNWRDALLFSTGLLLTIHELVIRTGPERPTILILLAGMMGLPAFLRGDEKEADREDKVA